MSVLITSRRNEIIRTAVRLSGSAEFRREQRQYFLEGARLCADAAQSGVLIQVLMYTERAEEKYQKYLDSVRERAQEIYMVSPQAAEAMAGTKTTQGVFCICRMPDGPSGIAQIREGHYLAVENLQDPANLGTILRTAEALGADGVILGGHCCDLYSPKVLRASMGAVFRLYVLVEENLTKALSDLTRRGFLTVAAVPDADAEPVTRIDFSGPCVLAVGNEGNGLTNETRTVCSIRATIPMRGRAESLNASAAAAILIWEMMRSGTGGIRT